MLRRIGEQMPPGTSSPSREPRFVGRDQEYNRLRRLYASARAGESQAVVLYGEGGIGKTRIAKELLAQGQLDGASTVRVACQPQDRHRPLSVFGELVERLQTLPGALGCAPSSLRVLRSLNNAPTLPPEHTPTRAETERSSADISTAIHDLFDAVAAEQALLLLVDDAHWLDDPSKELICSLVSTASSQRTLMVLTSRQSNLLVGDHAGAARVTHLRVAPLSRESAEAVLGDLATDLQGSIDAELSQWLLKTAAGNPFLLQALIAHYRVHRSRFSVPEKLTELLGRRLDQLATTAARVFDACIMLGRHATIARLRAVSELPNVELLECVRRLEEEGFIISDGPQLRSSHDLLSEVAISRLPPGATKLLHLQCARALEVGLNDQTDAGLLWDCAEHWNGSGETAQAAQLLRSCASHAVLIGHPQYAASLLQRAAELSTSPDVRHAILRELIHAAMLADDAHLILVGIQCERQLRSTFDSGSETSRHNDHELLEISARSAVGEDVTGCESRLFDYLTSENVDARHRIKAARHLLAIALQSLRPELAQQVRQSFHMVAPTTPFEVQQRLCLELFYHTEFGEIDRVVPLCAEVMSTTQPLKGEYSAEKIAQQVAYSLYIAGRLVDSRSLLTQNFEHAERTGSSALAHWCACCIADQLINEGDLSCAKHWLTTADQLQRTLKHHAFVGGSPASVIRIALLEGRPDEAEVVLLQAEKDFAALQLPRNSLISVGYHTRIQLMRGEKLNEEYVRKLRVAYPQAKLATNLDDVMAALWTAERSLGRRDAADATLREYLTTYRRVLYPPSTELQRISSQLI
jgi:hypothetical protein